MFAEAQLEKRKSRGDTDERKNGELDGEQIDPTREDKLVTKNYKRNK